VDVCEGDERCVSAKKLGRSSSFPQSFSISGRDKFSIWIVVD